MRTAGKPIRLILLKARQWGGSTCIQIYMAWLQMMQKPGLNSLIMAQQNSTGEEIREMYERMLERYPAPEKPEEDEAEEGREGARGRGRRLVSGGGATRAPLKIRWRNCKVSVGTAERPDGIRGGDYSLVHCSEVGLWKSTTKKTPDDIVRSACSGVLLRPLTMIVFESTANGTGNFFHREYVAAKRGESQFAAMFVPWYEIEQYSAVMEADELRAMAGQLLECRGETASGSDRREPGCYLWKLWESGATLEAIGWYERERRKYSEHSQMASEYPSDDVEAFAHSGRRVFDSYRVEKLRSGCAADSLKGDLTARRRQGASSGLLESGAIGSVRFEARGDRGGDWEIWKYPEPGCGEDRYVAVVDVGGRSHRSDWSVIAVFDRGPMSRGEGPEIVAQWRGHIDFDKLAEEAAKGASYYGNALLVVESNTLESRDPARTSESEQSEYILERLHRIYPNLYRRGETALTRGQRHYGFHTNAQTKPMVVSTLVEAVREGLYTERSEGCLEEYLQYEQRPDGSYGAVAGKHDDMLMTRAIGLYVIFHKLEPLRRVYGERPGVSQDEAPGWVDAASAPVPWRPAPKKRRNGGFASW